MQKPNGNIRIRDNGGNIFVSIYRCLSLGFQNFLRNKYLSLATITVMAVMIFIFNIILAVQFIGNQALAALSEKVDIVIYLRDDVDLYDANQLTESLKTLPGVKGVKFTSKEEALEIISKTHPKTAEFLQKFNLANPLPPSISITTRNADDHLSVQKFLSESEHKPLMQNYITDEGSGQGQIISEVARNLGNISHFVRQLIFWIILAFVIGGTLVIVNAIQLTIFTRRQEVQIMRLVGATPNFIRTPFILEGVLYGIIAVILSFVLLLIIGSNIQVNGSNLWSFYENINFNQVFFFELGVTIILASVSSFSAVQQYIKSHLAMN